MAVWSSVHLSELGGRFRIDAEYYQPYLLEYEQQLEDSSIPVEPLGNLVRDGYRVVYENTNIIESDEDTDPLNCVRFLQAADINRHFPAISAESMGWVARSDWERYPKGRISKGELLIEVKGLASKVAVVPDDFPEEVLVTGSVFKLHTREKRLDPLFLLAYLLSSYGVGLRFRSLTNTLIGYVSKVELYGIPTPVPSQELQAGIAKLVRRALDKQQLAHKSLASAESRLVSALGLDGLDLAPEKTYTRSFRDLEAGECYGAEYYMPCKMRALKALADMPHKPLSAHAPGVRDMFNPLNARPGQRVRNFDLTDALEPLLDDSMEPTDAAEIGSTKKRFRYGDLVVSRLRSYLKEIALVRTTNPPPPEMNRTEFPKDAPTGPKGTPAAVGSSEFIVLRPRKDGLSAETLMVYLRCPVVQTILKWSQNGSNHPRFEERDLLSIPVPNKLFKAAPEIDELVNASLAARCEAASLLDQAKRRVENLISDSALK